MIEFIPVESESKDIGYIVLISEQNTQLAKG